MSNTMEDDEIKKILLIRGLKNAVEFNGKPNKKAVMGKLMAEKKELRSQAKIIIPLLDQIIEENKLILVKQYRIPIKQDLWEIPAGKIEKGEKPEDCAYRELEEEAGVEKTYDGNVIHLNFNTKTGGSA